MLASGHPSTPDATFLGLHGPTSLFSCVFLSFLESAKYLPLSNSSIHVWLCVCPRYLANYHLLHCVFPCAPYLASCGSLFSVLHTLTHSLQLVARRASLLRSVFRPPSVSHRI
jgi:hypothetical protein